MRKCKLCGKELRDSYHGNICRECRTKVGGFAGRSAAGLMAAAGAVAAGLAIKAKIAKGEEPEEEEKKSSLVEGVKAAGKAGIKAIDKADAFIDEHSLGAKDLLDKSIDAAEYRMMGLSSSFAKVDKIGIKDRIMKAKEKIRYIDEFDDEYEETSDQIADINRR